MRNFLEQSRPELGGAGKISELDPSTAIGIVGAFLLMLVAITGSSGGLPLFFDLDSLIIVLGGTLGATLVSFPVRDFKRAFAILRNAFFPDAHSAEHRMQKIIELSRRARISGTLSLEGDILREGDPFLRKAMELLVDDLNPEEIETILDLELSSLEDRHRQGAQLFQTMGTIAPAMGLIGTLIGLVQMLQHIQEPTQIGSGMAIALLTTLYGSVLSYMLFLPLAAKLRTRSREEALTKEMTVNGFVAIARGVNPRLIEQRLLGFLPPEKRVSQFN